MTTFAMDDVDLAELVSPPRVAHRRVLSDPPDFMHSVRAQGRFPTAPPARFGGKRVPEDEGADESQMVKKQHISDSMQPRSRPPSSNSGSSDADEPVR